MKIDRAAGNDRLVTAKPAQSLSLISIRAERSILH